jgi:cytochrome c553
MSRWSCAFRILAAALLAALVAAPALTDAQAPAPAGPPASAMVMAQKTLPWAFNLAAPGQVREDDGKVKTLEGSAKEFTVPQINDPFAPPDWYPDEHPPMPPIVATGRRPDVRACAQCHMPHGLGHPESSGLAALPASYIRQQMEEFKDGSRKNSGIMTVIAKGLTEAELNASADYFASLPMKQWTRIVEADTVPKTYVGPGNMRFVSKEGGMEPIAGRIIELPENAEHAELRDPHSSFMAYVPPGSIKRGQQLVETGANKTVRCTLCHGAQLKGMGPVPSLAARSPIYIVRQLYSFQHGLRDGLWTDLMREAVARLTVDDMVAIAAYTASRQP